MATLINKQYLLTTAHCLHITSNLLRPAKLQIWLGIANKNQVSPGKAHLVEKIIIHPEYKHASSSEKGDLALIKLKMPIVPNKHIQPVCLGPAQRVAVGARAQVISWGRISETR